MLNKLSELWEELYSPETSKAKLENFFTYLKDAKEAYKPYFKNTEKDWYKDAVIYSLYVDLFNKDLKGLIEKLDYLQELGINCIWLLPILESPMKDAGFDISDYTRIRNDLTNGSEKIFETFLFEAHQRGIRVIFDIALNHCSVEHPWFKRAITDKNSKERDYFIWSDTEKKYKDARIIFKGLCKSNWEWEPNTKQYYYHRFFEIQPDLNYKNPGLLLEMTKILINWKIKGLDGFRADAIPYIWKEEGTDCENLPRTHTVVKFFRAALDYLEEGTMFLAEACQPPKKVVEYFGDGDECNSAYHFPVMPRIYRSMAEEKNDAIRMALSPDFTPETIPDSAQWLMFLRCHDELTLEMVTPEERTFIFDYYCKSPSWSFREGEGVSARLASLLEENTDRIKLAYSIMFSLLGTPIIFYGDEFAKTNDESFYEEQVALTKIEDSRYLVRGRIDWEKIDASLTDKSSNSFIIYDFLKKLIKIRKNHPALGRGSLSFVDIKDDSDKINNSILAYERTDDKSILIIQNLSARKLRIQLDISNKTTMLGSPITEEEKFLTVKPYGFYWFGEK